MTGFVVPFEHDCFVRARLNIIAQLGPCDLRGFAALRGSLSSFFSRVHATLQPAPSVGRSVGPSVGPSVGNT